MDKNYQFFKENFGALLKKYPNKQVLIYNESVVGVYDTFDAAYQDATKRKGLSLGTFLIQQCNEGGNAARIAWYNVTLKEVA
jgi:hypothetical protein